MRYEDIQPISQYLSPPPCNLNILMVTDLNGHYELSDAEPQRGLTEVIAAVRALSRSVNVRVRTAHREPRFGGTNGYAATAEFQGFTFQYSGAGERSLENYDEIWLFGIQEQSETPDPNALTPEEVTAISRFMTQRRGGVLAMGDHYTLGTSLCGNVPRVRLMRHWAAGDTPGAVGDRCPGFNDRPRLDTRIKPPGVSQETFNCQIRNEYESDAIPQPIEPVMSYITVDYWGRFADAPHPLLWGPYGIIRVMPDHMHEGDCYVPETLAPEFNDLYPEVIAYGINRATPSLDPGRPHRPRFGLISTHTGDYAQPSIGRVVVQSTWHHFVHLNVKGFATTTDPVSMRHWEQIKAYYRNLASWLAPIEKRRCMLRNLTWQARWHGLYSEHLASFRQPNPFELIFLGRSAFEVLNVLASHGLVVESLLDLIDSVAPNLNAHALLNPWHGKRQKQDEQQPQNSPSLLDTEAIYACVLGAAMYRIYEAFPSPTIKPEALKELETTLPKLLQEGARNGLTAFGSILKNSTADLTKFQKTLQVSLKQR